MSASPKILITGASGMLGSSLAPFLRNELFNVSTLGRFSNSDYVAESTSFSQTFKILDSVRPDTIIHLAALTNVDECEARPQYAYLANIRPVECITSWVKSQENKCHLIYISTDQVYDGIGPHKETDVQLSNYYSFSKYGGELAALQAPLTTILRTNFFGRSISKTRTSLSDWLIKALRSNNKITVFEDIYFSPLSITTLTKLIKLVIQRECAGIYNLGSKDGMSKADFAYALANSLCLPTTNLQRGSFQNLDGIARRPKDMRMDCSKFEKVFSYELPTLISEILTMESQYAD